MLKVIKNAKIDEFLKRVRKIDDGLCADQPLVYLQEQNDKKPWQESEVLHSFIIGAFNRQRDKGEVFKGAFL